MLAKVAQDFDERTEDLSAVAIDFSSPAALCILLIRHASATDRNISALESGALGAHSQEVAPLWGGYIDYLQSTVMNEINKQTNAGRLGIPDATPPESKQQPSK